MAERTSQADQEEQGQQDGHVRSAGGPPSETLAAADYRDVDSVEEQMNPTQPEEESECPGCQSLGALTLPCGHKLCPRCIQLSHGEGTETDCTICYGSQLMDSVLHTLLDALFLGQPRRGEATPPSGEESVWGARDEGTADGYDGLEKEELCVQHGEPLSEFCLEEKEPICQQCQTDEHEEHQCCSVPEAVLICKVRHQNQDRGTGQQLENH